MKMMQKLFAVMILALFIVSIMPAALAEEGSDDEIRSETRVRVGDVEVREETRIKDGEIREKVREKVKDVREDIQETREKIREVREEHREDKDRLLQLRSRVKDCGTDREECRKSKIDLRLGVRLHLVRSIEVMEKSLENLQARIENSDLSDSEKEGALAKIAELQEKLASQKAELEALAGQEDVDPAVLREKIKELKDTWKEIQKEQRKLVARLVHSKLGDLDDKHHGLLRSMDARIDSLEKQGVDVSELVAIMARFEAHVAEVDAQYAAAKEAWQAAEDKDEALDAWKAAQLELRASMKESQSILREFVAKFTELKKSVGDDAEDSETEVEVEVEAEAEVEAETETNDVADDSTTEEE
ncbi:hypothetical protein COV20_02955 [Candidatus Woesearchaeota archaeon CG10_big_fil_rev_8_21_14_0_10_45_16]|nr:MAG: hypothetical protein COV20_02955 [Candidatus Woesearchaeota archaeon CG10_big_fil_rev_8_21_14_0_10_45_16]